MSEHFYWPYRLELAHGGKLNARTANSGIDGALVRHRDGGVACLQPWPTLGQGILEESLNLLRDGGSSDLVAACRRCIALDGAARAAGKSLFEGKTVPQSHLTVPDWADLPWLEKKKSAGFIIFKLKCGPDLGAEVHRIAAICEHFGTGLRLRLDFNESLDAEGFREFVGMLGNYLPQVEFFEDPVPFDPSLWAELAAELNVDLAVDRAADPAESGFAVRVLKPAWGAVRELPETTMFTSAMDHPIGQLFAAHEASIYTGKTTDAGLLTHWLFEPNDFSELLAVEDRRLVPPGGAGLGFGDLLERLPWRAL